MRRQHRGEDGHEDPRDDDGAAGQGERLAPRRPQSSAVTAAETPPGAAVVEGLRVERQAVDGAHRSSMRGYEHRVENVDEEVDHDVDDGDHHAHPHDGGQVEVDCAVEGILADAGPRVDALDQHGARQEAPEGHAEDRGDRDQRRAHDMAADHRPLPQSLGPGRPHVVVAHDLEHRRPGESQDQPDGVDAEDERRQDQMVEGVDEERPSPRQQGVLGVEPGDRRRRADPGGEAPASREPAEAVEEEVEGKERQPEGRDRDTDEAEHPEGPVDHPPPPDCGHDAEGDAEHHAEHDGEKGQLDGGGNVVAEIGGHGPVALLRGPQVAAHQAAEVDQVLLGHRLVEPVTVVEGGHRRRVADGSLTEVGRGRVTGDQVGEDEGHEGDPDHQHQAGGDPAQQEPADAGGGEPPGPARQ